MTAIKEQLELGTKVLEHIQQHPEQHDNGSWFSEEGDEYHREGCGTTRCVAGWTLHFAGYQMRCSAGNPMQIRRTPEEQWEPVSGTQFAARASDLLGLDSDDADDMFQSGDEEAVDLLADHVHSLSYRVKRLEETA